MAENTSINAEQIIVIDKNGNLKLIAPGEKVLPGEIIVEGSSGSLVVNSVDLPEESDDIDAILSAIVYGQDPSLIADAPAAGEGNGSSLTTSTEIERIGKSTIAETSFDTSSLESVGLSKTQSLTLLEQYKAYRETGEFQIPDPSNGLVKTAPTLSIQEVDENGVINEERAENGIQVEVTLPIGTEEGDKVELHDGDGKVVGEHLITEDDITNGKVEITVPTPTPDGSYEYVADITDPSGDKGPRSTEVEFELDTTAPGDGEGDNGSDVAPKVLIDSGEDDIINADEKDVGVTATITLPEGTNIAEDSVVVTFSDGTTDTIKLSETTVTDGKFSVAIPAAAIVDGQTTEVSAIIVDVAGNESATGSDTADVDLVAPGDGEGDNGSDVAPTVLIDSGEDDIINADEKDAGVTATFTLPEGTNIAEDSVVVTFSDGTIDTIKLSEITVTDGKFSVAIPAAAIVDGQTTEVSAIVVDGAGNKSATGSDTAGVDLVAPGDGEGDNGGDVAPTVVIDSGGDDTINADEKDAGVTATITLPEGTNIAEDSVVVTFSDGTTE
ncbi:hypothetical protein PVK63_06305, partial [Aliivibrio sp. S2TY2]|nr:hypothetical protein [Aliivibrio sp. S3TY1]MDD9191560.1 hypothetical protein [Aliivibrio sp. S2TY2]